MRLGLENAHLKASGVAVMTVKPATKAKPRRGRKPAQSEAVWYVIAIEGWDWRFSFGVEWRKDSADPYSDYRHLKLRGKMIRPLETKANGAEAAIVLVPWLTLNEGHREKHNPTSVGSLHFYRGQVEGGLSVPADVVPSLLTMLAANQFRYLTLEGTKAHYGQVEIKSYSFDMSLADDE